MSIYAPCPMFGSIEIDYAIFLSRMAKKGHEVYLGQMQRWLIQSALARHDERCAEEWIVLWQRTKVPVTVKKWPGGDHFYAHDKKFNTYDEARDYLKERGYKVSPGVEQKPIPFRREGD